MSRYERQLEQLRSLKSEIESQIAAIDSSKYNESPGEGMWNVAQTLEHVMTAELGSMTYIRRKLSDPSSLPKAGLRQTIQNNLLFLALKTRFRFKAPAVVSQTNPEGSVDELLSQWSEHRRELEELIENFPDELADRCVFRHPVSGRMTLSQTLGFMIGHLRHHTVQFERIAKALSARGA